MHQPVHEVPTRINTPEITDLPELSLEEIADRYGRYWHTSKVYFPGGERSAEAVLDSFVESIALEIGASALSTGITRIGMSLDHPIGTSVNSPELLDNSVA